MVYKYLVREGRDCRAPRSLRRGGRGSRGTHILTAKVYRDRGHPPILPTLA